MHHTSGTVAAALQRLPLFAGIPEAALQRLAGRTSFIYVEAGKLVLDYNDPTTDVFVTIHGTIRVSVPTPDGSHARIVGDFHGGDFVGEIAAIDGAPRSARVEALVNTRLCRLPAEAFLAVAAEVPAVGLRIMQLLTARLRVQNQVLLEHTSLPIRLRLGAELLRIARPRADGTLVVSPVPTQQDLADRVGARRETVSRELGGLERDGLLQRGRAAMVLPQPRKLEAAIARGPQKVV